MVFKKVEDYDSFTKAKDVNYFFQYNAVLFISVFIGKNLSSFLMKRILSSGGFYKLKTSANNTESKASPNIQALIAGAEYWWNLTELLLVTSFLTKKLDIYFIHGIFLAECGYHYWRTRGQSLYVKQQCKYFYFSTH